MSVKTDDFDKAVAKGIVKDVGGCQIAMPAAVVFGNADVIVPKVVPLGKSDFFQPLRIVCRYVVAGFVPAG